MNKIMDHPWLLRITALLLAILLFFTVKPEQENTKTISGTKEETIEMPLTVDYDSDNFVMTGAPEKVVVKISGPVGIVLPVKNSKDFKVFLDLKDQTIGTHSVKVKVSGLSDKVDYTLEPSKVTINIEERISKQVKVEPQITQKQLTEGHYVVASSAEPQTVTVKGAANIIQKIAYVKAIVPGSGISKAFESDVAVKAFDAQWNALDVEFAPKNVHVKVDVDEYNRQVPIKVKQTGKPADGIKVISATPQKDTITLYGPKAIVDAIKELTVSVDVSDMKKSQVVSAPVVLPNGVSYAADSKVDVNVVTNLDNEDLPTETADSTSKTIKNVPINVLNYDPDAYNIQFERPNPGVVNLTISGDADELKKLTVSDFNVSVDATDVSEGSQKYTLHIEAPTGIKAKSSVTEATINFTKK